MVVRFGLKCLRFGTGSWANASRFMAKDSTFRVIRLQEETFNLLIISRGSLEAALVPDVRVPAQILMSGCCALGVPLVQKHACHYGRP